MQRHSQLTTAVASIAIVVAACAGVTTDRTTTQPRPTVESEQSSTTAAAGAESTTNSTVVDGGHLSDEQDLEYLAELLESTVQLDEETARLLESDAPSLADAFSISVEKARVGLLFELAFRELKQTIRQDSSLAAVLADAASGPPEGPIGGHICFVGEIPDKARDLVAASEIAGLVTLHGGSMYTIEEVELLTRDIAEATLDLGFTYGAWYDTELQAFIVALESTPDAPDMTDQEILDHLAENIRDPQAADHIIIRRVDST